MLKRWSLIPAVAVALLAGSCGTDASPASTSDGVAAGGCSRPHEARDETVTVEFGGMERSYMVVGPESSNPLPVVMAYHGFTKDAAYHRAISGLAEEAVERGFIVVFPEGTIPEDGTRPYFNIGTNDDESLADDIGFTEEILDQLEEEYCIDNSRVYATGWSTGGMFASTLACELHDRFTAVAAVSGVLLHEDCPDRPIPIIILHGTADSYVPYQDAAPDHLAERTKSLGGSAAQIEMFRGVDLNPIDYIDLWVEHNGCQKTPEVAEEAARLEVTKYQDCGVETVILEAGVHRWEPYPTARILDFFFENQLAVG